jgi:glycine/D-amino acid oxidase-like deaminating enzyme
MQQLAAALETRGVKVLDNTEVATLRREGGKIVAVETVNLKTAVELD